MLNFMPKSVIVLVFVFCSFLECRKPETFYNFNSDVSKPVSTMKMFRYRKLDNGGKLLGR